MPENSSDNLFDDLKSITASAFPKTCTMCNKVYNNEEDFIKETSKINNQTGLKQSYDDDDQTIVELYRNCSCGSTLMNFFGNRRDVSEAGEKRREKFGRLMEYLIAEGLEASVARNELLKVVHGQKSEILKDIKFPDI